MGCISAVLHMGAIKSPVDAVRAAIVAEHHEAAAARNVCMVIVTDPASGREFTRASFPTKAECDAFAAAQRAKGYNVNQVALY